MAPRDICMKKPAAAMPQRRNPASLMLSKAYSFGALSGPAPMFLVLVFWPHSGTDLPEQSLEKRQASALIRAGESGQQREEAGWFGRHGFYIAQGFANSGGHALQQLRVDGAKY